VITRPIRQLWSPIVLSLRIAGACADGRDEPAFDKYGHAAANGALRNERQCGAETEREFLELWFGETRFTAFGRCSEYSAAPLLNVA
jgi:hypothetical protein